MKDITKPDYKMVAENLTKVVRMTNETIGAQEIHHALLSAAEKGIQEGIKKGFEEARCMMQKEYL